MDEAPFDVIAYTLLSLLGVVALLYLIVETWAMWTRRAGIQRIPAPLAPTRPQPEPAGQQSSSRAQASTKPPAPTSNPRDRLQRLLDRGVALEQRAAGPLAGLSILEPQTRPEDVDAWEAEVEAALRGRPRDVALFRYEPLRSPLDAIGVAAIMESPLKRRLRQRTKQLGTIIQRMP